MAKGPSAGVVAHVPEQLDELALGVTAVVTRNYEIFDRATRDFTAVTTIFTTPIVNTALRAFSVAFLRLTGWSAPEVDGVDWFDVDGEVDFGAARAALPDLLRALGVVAPARDQKHHHYCYLGVELTPLT